MPQDEVKEEEVPEDPFLNQLFYVPEDQGKMRTIHFIVSHQIIKKATKVFLNLLSDYPQSLAMIRISDCSYYSNLTIQNEDNIYVVKYQYLVKLPTHDVVSKVITERKGILGRFNQIYFKYKIELDGEESSIDSFTISDVLLQNFNNQNIRILATPYIFRHFQDYMIRQNKSLHFSLLLKSLFEKLKKSKEQEFEIYTITLIAILLTDINEFKKSTEENKKIINSYLAAITKHLGQEIGKLGMLRQKIRFEKLHFIHDFEKGLNTLLQTDSLINLQFLMDDSSQLSSILAKIGHQFHQERHQVAKTLKYLQDSKNLKLELKQIRQIKTIFLTTSRSYSELFQAEKEIKQLNLDLEEDEIEWYVEKLMKKSYVANSIEPVWNEIMNRENIAKVLKQDIMAYVKKLILSNGDYLQRLKASPYILKFDFMLDLLNFSDGKVFKVVKESLIFESLNYQKGKCPKNDEKRFLQILIDNSITKSKPSLLSVINEFILLLEYLQRVEKASKLNKLVSTAQASINLIIKDLIFSQDLSYVQPHKSILVDIDKTNKDFFSQILKFIKNHIEAKVKQMFGDKNSPLQEKEIFQVIDCIPQDGELTKKLLQFILDYYKTVFSKKGLHISKIFENQVLRKIFSNDIFVTYHKKHAFIDQIKAQLKKFIKDIQELNISMPNIKIFIQSKESLKALKTMCIVLEVQNEKIIKQAIERYENIEKKLQKYKIFIDYLQYMDEHVDISKLLQALLIAKQVCEQKTLKELQNLTIWAPFKGLNSSKKYYAFDNSSFFTTFFESKKQKIIQKLHQQGGLENVKVEPKLFDKISEEFLFREFYNKLLLLEAYPQPVNNKQITHKFLQKYLHLTSEKAITWQLEVLAKGFKVLDSKEHQVNINFKRDLINYSQLDILRQKSLCLGKLLDYCPENARIQISNDEGYIKLRNFQDFYMNIEGRTPLVIIAEQIVQNNEYNTYFLQKFNAKFSELERIAQSKDTYNFCLEHTDNQGKTDFNELREKLENDNEGIPRSIIDDLQVLAKDFQTIYNQIQMKFKAQAKFMSAVIFLVAQFRVFDKDTFKALKLEDCNRVIKSLQSLDKAHVNPDESTIKIIQQALKSGEITFIQDSEADIFTYAIKIQGINNLIIDQDKIWMHSSRGILLITSKSISQSNEESQKRDIQFKENVLLFSQILQVANDIILKLDQLYQTGDKNFKFTSTFYLNDSKIKEKLIYYNKTVNAHIENNQKFLRQGRDKFYLLNYLQDRRIRILIDYLKSKGNQDSIPLAIFQLIYRKIQINEINNKPALGGLGQQNFKQDIDMIGKFFEENITNKIQLEKLNYQPEDNLAKYVQKGKVAYKHIQHDFEAVKTILYYFSLTSYKPESSQILFGRKDTTLSDIEIFLNRVFRAPEYFLKQQEERLFVILNFEDLPSLVQQKAVKMISDFESQDKSKEILLFIVCIFHGSVKESNLDQQIKSKFSQPQLVDDIEFSKILLSMQSKVTCVYSSTPGVGKTSYIRQEIKAQELKYKRIPIQGDISRKKLARLHKDIINENSDQKLGIHYDVHPTFGESINLLLMELLIFGHIDDGLNELIMIPQDTQIFIEVSCDLNKQYMDGELFCKSFKDIEIRFDINVIKIDQNVDDKYQQACRFLKAYDNNNFDLSLITNPKVLTNEECILYIKKIYLNKIIHPNYYQLRNIIAFIGQLNYIKENKKLVSLIQNGDRQILGDIIKCNYDFSLSQFQLDLEFTETNKNLSLIKEDKESIEERRLEANRWANLKGACIIITNEGELIPIYKKLEDLPESIKAYLDKNSEWRKVKFQKEYSEFQQQDFIELILELCVTKILRQGLREHQNINLNSIVFTKDNFMKLSLIYLRMRAKLPVILMGETGVGKTAVVQYLSQVLQSRFYTLDVHAGLSEKKILDWLSEKIDQAEVDQSKGYTLWTVIFLDEINTNPNIQGILKEVLIDKHLLGRELPSNVRLIAACNPYKHLPKGQTNMSAGLEYNLSEKSLLVYNVKELSLSMHENLYDYGSLLPEEEAVYIEKLIALTNDNLKQEDRYSPSQIEIISSLVKYSQEYTRNKETQWAVSLRDVSRFTILLKYFLTDKFVLQTYKRINKLETRKLRSLVMSLTSCYYFRIISKQQRSDYIKQLCHVWSQSLKDSNEELQLKKDQFQVILKEELGKFLNEIEIPHGIGKNTPLMENVFVIMTCILNKIPLIICGKPGSSKTLAMNLISKSMRGQQSSSELFQMLPALIIKSYQGSEQSTSQGVKSIFESAIRKQRLADSDNLNIIVMVLIDEIGLADHASTNPLKVLHSLLEPRDIQDRVAFVGISNWSLDASKMNRVITLSRTDPCNEDLKESLSSIAEDICRKSEQLKELKAFQMLFAEKLVDTYSAYIKEQNESIPAQFRYFHGLRDLYSAIAFISNNLIGSVEDNLHTIKLAFERNFNGKLRDKTKICPILSTAMQQQLLNTENENEDEILEKTTKLIKDNIEDQKSRHLFLFTDSIDSCVQHLQSVLFGLKRQFKVFAGSDFEDDKKREALYDIIKEIILQMEQGGVVVLLDLEDIYQAFYDVLNMNYQEVQGKLYSKVALGSDSTRCLVHPQFKCILITSTHYAKDMDPPLLNRFEKQVILQSDTITDEVQEQIISFKQWRRSLKNIFDETIQEENQITSNYKTEVFIGLNKSNLTSMIMIPKDEDSLTKDDSIKKIAIQLATFVYMRRYQTQQSQIKEQEENVSFEDEDDQEVQQSSLDLFNIYEQDGIHESLENLIDMLVLLQNNKQNVQEERKQSDIENQESNPKYFSLQTSSAYGLNIVAHTYSSSLAFSNKYQELVKTQILNQICSRSQLEQLLENFLNPQSINIIKAQYLIIFADSLYDKDKRLSLVMNLINSQRARVKQICESRNNKPSLKHIIIVLRHDETNSSTVQFQEQWQQLYIDTINNIEQSRKLTLNDMSTTSIEDLLAKDNYCLLKDLISEAFLQSISCIAIPREGAELEIIYNKLRKLILGELELCTDLAKLVEIKIGNDSYKDIKWVNNIMIKDVTIVRPFQSLHEACYEYLIKITVEPLSHLFYLILKYSSLILYDSQSITVENFNQTQNIRQFSVSYLKYIVEKVQFEDFGEDQTYEIENHHLILSYPFSNEVHKEFLEIEDDIIDELIQNQDIINEKLSHLPENSVLEVKLQIEDETYQKTLSNMERLEFYFPLEFRDLFIFNFEVDIYLENLPLILYPNEDNQQFQEFLVGSLKLFSKKDKDCYYSLTNMYSTYWRQDTLIQSAYAILESIPSQIQKIDDLITKFFNKVKATAEYQSPHYELKYLPRSTYIQCLAEIIFDTYHPTKKLFEVLNTNDLKWSNLIDSTFTILDELFKLYPQHLEFSKFKIFALLYYFEVFLLEPLKLNSVEYFIEQVEVFNQDRNFSNLLSNVESTCQKILNQENINDSDINKSDVDKQFQQFKFKMIQVGLQKITSEQELSQIISNALLEIRNRFSNLSSDNEITPLLFTTLNQICKLIEKKNNGIFADLTKPFDEWVKNDLLQILNKSLTEVELSYEHPYVIALCDAIQQNFQAIEIQNDEEEKSNFTTEKAKENLIISIQLIQREDTQILRRLQSLAFFKYCGSIIAEQFADYVKGGEGSMIIELQKALDMSFIGKLEENIHLIRYIIKLMLQHLDLEDIRKFGPTKFEWMKRLQLPVKTQEYFPLCYSEQQRKFCLYSNMKNEYKLPEGDLPNMQISLNLFEVFYLQSSLVDKETKNNLIQQISSNENLTAQKKDILLTTLTCGEGKDQWIQEEFKFQNDQDDKEKKNFQKLMAFLHAGILSSPSNSYVQQIIYQPNLLSEIYVPFMAASKEDDLYFKTWYSHTSKDKKFVRTASQMMRLRCINCSQILIIQQSGQPIQENKNDEVELKCTKCPMFVQDSTRKRNTKIVDKTPLKFGEFYKQLENTEALKGYIYYEDESVLDDIHIRFTFNGSIWETHGEWSFRFGQTLLHLLLMSATLFTSQENLSYLGQVLTLNKAEITQQNIYNIFKSKAKYGLKRLATRYNLTEEKIIAIFMGIIKNMVQKHEDPELSKSQLCTVEGRKVFEKKFLSDILPSSAGNFQKYFQELLSITSEMDYFEEKIDLEIIKKENYKEYENGYFSILRKQLKIDENQLLKYVDKLKRSNSQESRLKKYLLLEQTLLRNLDLVNIGSLRDIMKWIRYANIRWGGKVKRSDSLDFSIRDIIDRDCCNSASKEGEDRQKKDNMMLEMLIEATQQFDGVVYQDGCEEVILHPITENSKFQACCATTIKKNSMGYPLGLMIHQLCIKQNEFLDSVKEMSMISYLYNNQNNSKKLMSLKDSEIIQTDFDKITLFQMVHQNSFSDHRYGKGQINSYLIEEINEQLIQDIIYEQGINRVYIDYDSEDIDFAFSDDGSLFIQQAKILECLQQETNENCKKIVENLKNETERTKFLNCMRIAINYLANSCKIMLKKNLTQRLQFSNKLLTEFLRTQKLEVFTDQIGPQVQIKHLLHLYEEVEQSLLDSLVERTHLKYRENLLRGTNDMFKSLNDKQQHLMRSILGRLCARHLAYEEQLNQECPLFQQLTTNDYHYLYGIQYQQFEGNSNREAIEMLQKLQAKYENVTFSHAYAAFQLLKQNIEDRKKFQQKSKKEKESREVKHMIINHSFLIGKDSINKIQEEQDQKAKDRKKYLRKAKKGIAQY